MTCHNCSSLCKKFGKFGPKRIQRYRFKQCKKTFSEDQNRPLDYMRLDLDRAEMCLSLMVEGMSLRSIQRITGVHQEVAYYNFCRVHSTIRCTPPMEAGIRSTIWTIRDLLAA